MMNKAISFTFLCMLIPFSRCQFCQIQISRNETKDLCCADYEKREKDCIACSTGYTSDVGQNCKPCPKNNYGERCLFECSCQDFEVCDNVEGCVQASSTTDSFMYETSETFSDKTCVVVNESGEKLKVCCSDFEEKGNGCRACLKGFTSDIGQNCRPCPKHSYGEKCDFVCSCTNNEICDPVDGCVEISSTTGTSVDASSYKRTYRSTRRTSTYSVNDKRTYRSTKRTSTYSVNDITSLYRGENTNTHCTGCSDQGLFSREIIVYSALSVLVIGFGICLIFVLFKYKTLRKKYIVTTIQTLSVPQQIQTIEIADRLYDIINEEDIIDDRRIQQIQKEMSSNYLDVIHDSNTRESCESKSLDNQDNPCQLLSIIQTQNPENNLKVDDRSLMSGDSTSSSDEYQWDSTQDYLNPYQPMIEISPPEENKYLTIATAYFKDATTNV